MKLAILTTENQEPNREYHKPDPWFGTAPEALLQGFSNLPPAEVHFSCTYQSLVPLEKIASYIFQHSLSVSKIC